LHFRLGKGAIMQLAGSQAIARPGGRLLCNRLFGEHCLVSDCGQRRMSAYHP
jgi:hypothetical protein